VTLQFWVWSLQQTFRGLREEAPVGWFVFLAGATTCSVLIALQETISFTVAFGTLLASGLALGVVGPRMRDCVIAGFIMGYVAFAVGSVVGVFGMSLAAGYPPESVVGYTAIGVLVGVVFGTLAGIWTAGGAAVGFVVRRRPHAGHLL
jgi:hypothetical protein